MTKRVAESDLSIDEQARDWVLRLASEEISRSEIDACKAWLASDPVHQMAFERRRSVWQTLSNHPEVFKVASPLPRPSRIRPIRGWIAIRPRSFVAGTIAASIAVVLAVPQLLLWAGTDYRTSTDILQIALSDGSMATLDSASAIAVDFDGHERRVALLRGNAFFTVRHGDPRPFRVAASGGVTEDIGTSFEVRQEPGRTAVTVAQGAVRVRGRDATSVPAVQLRAGETAVYDTNGRITTSRISSLSSIAAWREGELLIDGLSISDAIAAVARYRRAPTWVWTDLSGGVPVSGAFRTDRADDALQALANEAGLSISWLPGGIAIVRSRSPS